LDSNRQVGIDLHIHSNASDGTLSPSEILSLAVKYSLGAIAITDHDTVDGAKQALALGIPPTLKFLTGVEVSADPPPGFHCPGSFHILGYGLDLDDPELNHTLEKLQDARENRNPRIIQRLNELGVDISLKEVRVEAGDGQVGRPHIARVMIKRGFAQSIDDAFDRFLGKGKPAYVDKFRLSSAEAISLIRTAGGIPVLAHPFLLETESEQALEGLICVLKEMGLLGLEVHYPSHSPAHVAQYTRLAGRHGLLMTGGTDYHGKIKPTIEIGRGTGDFFVPYALYEALANSISSPGSNPGR